MIPTDLDEDPRNSKHQRHLRQMDDAYRLQSDTTEFDECVCVCVGGGAGRGKWVFCAHSKTPEKQEEEAAEDTLRAGTLRSVPHTQT